jgi:hypothetical protein
VNAMQRWIPFHIVVGRQELTMVGIENYEEISIF